MPNTPNVEIIQREELTSVDAKQEVKKPKKTKYDEAITAFNNATAKALDEFVNLEA